MKFSLCCNSVIHTTSAILPVSIDVLAVSWLHVQHLPKLVRCHSSLYSTLLPVSQFLHYKLMWQRNKMTWYKLSNWGMLISGSSSNSYFCPSWDPIINPLLHLQWDERVKHHKQGMHLSVHSRSSINCIHNEWFLALSLKYNFQVTHPLVIQR